MPSLTSRRATAIAALVAALVFANALLNGWAGDDVLILRDNARVHSLAAAFAARFLPYWPPPWDSAGLYRPLAIFSYAVDWALGGGGAAAGYGLWIFHTGNVALHVLAVILVVRVALAWLSPLAALVAGLVFAVHPVHVEAVANIVGRAELLAACGVLGAVLLARRYRDAARDGAAAAWLGATVLVVVLAMLCKEHAIIATAVIAVDHWLDRSPAARRMFPLYAGLAAVTLGWLHVWGSIAGPYVATGATTAFHGLTRFQQVATMLPVQLDVLRLLAWPLDLASDYSPQTTALQAGLTVGGVVGLVAMAALVALGLLARRPAPVVAFGILVAAGSYAPTSNIFFTSGVVLAERALYLAVLAPALVLGWLSESQRGTSHHRLMMAAMGVLLVVFSGRTWTRTPYWETPQTEIIENAGDHPENYRARIHLGDLLASKGDTARALAEYLAAEALSVSDPFNILYVINSGVALGWHNLAIAYAWKSNRLAPGDHRPSRWLVQALLAAGLPDSAVAVARAAAMEHQRSAPHLDTYVLALDQAGARRQARLIGVASLDWLTGDIVGASATLDSLGARPDCPDLEIGRLVVLALRPIWAQMCSFSYP